MNIIKRKQNILLNDLFGPCKLIIHRPLLHTMGSHVGALILTKIIYWGGYYEKFYMPDKDLKKELGVSDHQIKTAKLKIKKLPFIKITKEDSPPVTYYHVDINKVMEHYTIENNKKNQTGGNRQIRLAQNEVVGENRQFDLVETASSSYINNNKENNNKKNAAPSKPPIDSRWDKYARNLSRTVSKIKNIDNTTRLPAWAKSIKQLHTIDKVPVPRIRDVLKWYCKNLPTRHKEKYFVQALSGSAFRNKFLKIEDAIQRDSENTTDLQTNIPELDKRQKTKVLPNLKKYFIELKIWSPEIDKGLTHLIVNTCNHFKRIDSALRSTHTACSLQDEISSKDSQQITIHRYLKSIEKYQNYFDDYWGFLTGYVKWVAECKANYKGYGDDLKAFMPKTKPFRDYFNKKLEEHVGWIPEAGLYKKFDLYSSS